MHILLGKGIRSVDEVWIFLADDRPLLRLLADGIFRTVDEIDDRSALTIVKTVRLIDDIDNGTQKSHDLIDHEVRRRCLARADMKEKIRLRRRRRVLIPVDALEILQFSRFLRLGKEIFPRLIAETQREFHRLRRDADVHRALNRPDAIRHISDDLALLLLVLSFQRKHQKDNALTCILEYVLCQIRIDLHIVRLPFLKNRFQSLCSCAAARRYSSLPTFL